jgi:cell division septation protein DedD
MANQPNPQARNNYYWYYATQVMHNVPGPDWDTWNRQMRRVLIESQCKEGCAEGSWDPVKPTKEALADQAGRLALTSLSALTLEVYYRYLPLYKLDTEAALKASKPLSKSVAEKTSTQSVESATAKLPSEMEKEKKAAADAKKPEAKPAAKPAATPAEKPEKK